MEAGWADTHGTATATLSRAGWSWPVWIYGRSRPWAAGARSRWSSDTATWRRTICGKLWSG